MQRGPLLGAVLLLCVLSAGLGYVLGGRASVATPAPTGHYLRQLSERLELSADQVERIDQLLTSSDADVRQLLEAHRVELREPLATRLDQTEAEILGVLDEGQRNRYHELNQAVPPPKGN